MKKVMSVIGLFSLMLIGCADTVYQKVVETKTVQLPPQIVNEIDQIVSNENEYRLSSGQMPLVKGLTCYLYDVSTSMPSSIPSVLPSSVAAFVYEGGFNQENSSASLGLNFLPNALKATYKQWFIVKCQGQIVIVDSGYEVFYLTSDDGSVLYVDGSVLIDNNGNHSSQTRSASKLLKRGIHTFRLDYMQANGSQSLILEDSNGVISGNKFYR